MKKLAVLLLAVALMTSCAGAPQQSGAPEGAGTAAVGGALSGANSIESSAAPETVQPENLATAQNVSSCEAQTEALSSAVLNPPPEAAGIGGTQPWWRTGLAREQFFIDGEALGVAGTYGDFNIYDDARKVSRIADRCFSALLEESDAVYYDTSLILNSAQESADIGARILPDNFFEIVACDDTKYTGEFYEKGIKLTRSLPGGDKGDSVLLALDAADYAKLQANIAERLSGDGYWGASWLSMMRRSRMVSATITSSDGKATHTLDFTKTVVPSDAEYLFNAYFYDDVNRGVYADSRGVTETSLPDAAKVEITFNNGLVYHIFYTKDDMLVHASDVSASLLYRLQSDYSVTLMDNYAYKRLNPKTGKPVLYLYPTEPTDCTVKVGYPLFTYTYPAYNDGWHVTAYPDGRLVDKTDGGAYYYLFWEGNERVNWDFSSGFLVKGSDTEVFLREKLAYMGLTPREYNDFITYWVPQMQYAAYNLITFAGDQYEALAPLTVTPAPDSVLRVHMVFKALDAPVAIPEQTLTPFERTGFTVVEWGATNAG